MRVRFQADADFNKNIVAAVLSIEPTVDFQTAAKADLKGVPDLEVLKRASSEKRLLVSHDQSSMPGFFAALIVSQMSSGLIIIPQSLSLVVAREELLTIWGASKAEEWINRITYLPL